MTVDWLEAQPIGPDAFGTTHYLQTVGTHTAFAAKTQAGKSYTARGFVAMSLLDPRVGHAVINGKPDDDMWLPMRDLCEVYVEGSSSATIPLVEQALVRLNEINDSRASGDKGRSRPYVVVVDEWYRIRKAAKRHDKKAAERIDGLIADLASTCSGRYMHIVPIVQRGTAEFLPGDFGANLGQRVQGVPSTPAEVRYFIHSRPDILPSKQGEFLVSVDEGGSSELVSVPFLDHAGFLEVCAAARRLRVQTDPAPVDIVKNDRPATWQELVAVILQEAPEPMTTTQIHEALPEDRRPTPHAETFGRLLIADAESADPTVTRSYTRSRTKAWSLATDDEPAQSGFQADSARSAAPRGRHLVAAP